jgi:RHH-type transcriptional regulator, rel operon repressor / antitoxin RelB
MRRSAEKKLRVVAVRVDPVIEQRLLVLAEATGRKQSLFLQRMIEEGIGAMEDTWLPSETLAKVRNGELLDLVAEHGTTSDLLELEAVDTEST